MWALVRRPEDAEALAAELIPAKFVTELGDSAWKVRLAALEEMTTWVEGCVQDLDSEVVVRFLGKKGFNEKNFQVRIAAHFAKVTRLIYF